MPHKERVMDSWNHRRQFSLKWSEVGKTVKESEIDQIRKQSVYWNPVSNRKWKYLVWVCEYKTGSRQSQAPGVLWQLLQQDPMNSVLKMTLALVFANYRLWSIVGSFLTNEKLNKTLLIFSIIAAFNLTGLIDTILIISFVNPCFHTLYM